ncbi:MAG: hypothetical protein HQL13_03685 [Candidatus Omnitrophica bacterium]|nr:hypothetical protein [Candidatus Omnitrophota bacterium]
MKIIACLLIIVISSSNSFAVDFATEHTQILNNIELITENIRQLQSLYNQIEMIKNQVEGLKAVANYKDNFNDIDALRNNLSSIISQGTNLSYQTQGLLSQIEAQVNSLPANSTMTDREVVIDQKTLEILQNAVNRVNQERGNYEKETNALNALMVRSNQAQGQTQALQTSNEIAAQSIAQMQSTRELLSENIIVQAVTTMREIQERRDMVNTMNQIVQNNDNSEINTGTNS